MTKVQMDDYYCEECNKTGLAELDIKTGKYTCLMCGEIDEDLLYEADKDIRRVDKELTCELN